MTHYSFFRLTAPTVTPDDALPAIMASEEDFYALIDCLHAAINTFHTTHPDLTYGDAIHAAKCLVHDLITGYAENTCDA